MPNYITNAVDNIRKRRKVNTIPDDPNNAQKPPSTTPQSTVNDIDQKMQMENYAQQQKFAKQMQKQVQTQNDQDEMEKLAQAQVRQIKKPRKVKAM
jgi:hypothetical protein